MIFEAQTAARYYNGVSARPYDANCYLFATSKELVIEAEGEESLHFPFTNLKISHRDKDLLILSTKDTSRRTIEIRNPHFTTAFLHYNRIYDGGVWYHRLLNAGLSAHLLLAAGILAICCGLYFFVVPFLAEQAVDLIPRSVDNKLGASIGDYNDEISSNDSVLSVDLNNYLHTLAPELDARYRIYVISNDEVNAFALPDGRIMVYTGILTKMKSHTELAGVLAHEISHVEHRHSMRLICRNISGYLLLTLVLNDVNGLMTTILDNAHNLQSLSYSRKFEREADLSGFNLLKSHHVNPQGMVDLFKMLEKEHSTEIPGWMSTHPVSSERIEYLQKEIKKHPYKINEATNLQVIFNRINSNLNYTSYD